MKTRNHFLGLAVAMILSLLSFPCTAAISINGVIFDSAVVNDNASQAHSSNYSCTQAGGTVSLNGQQPIGGAKVTYFYNHTSHGDESKFIAGFDFTHVIDTNSIMGIMYYSGQFVFAPSVQQWCKLGITGNRRIYFETHNFCDPPQKILLCTLAMTVTTAYIEAKMTNGYLNFFISDAPISATNDSTLIQIGLPTYFSFDHSYGFFLEPHTVASYERADFKNIVIVPRDSTNGIVQLNNYTISNLPGLTDWARMTLPGTFFNSPLKFISDIKTAYQAGGHIFADHYQRKLFTSMTNKLNFATIQPVPGDSELRSIQKSLDNAQLYLSDIVHSFITDSARKYPVGTTSFQLYYGFSLNDRLQEGIDLINTCHAATEVHWWDFFNPFEPFTRIYNIGDCASDIVNAVSKMHETMDVITVKDAILMDAALYIEYLTLIALLDHDFYNTYYPCIYDYIERVRSYTNKIAPLYTYNNIPMKVLSAIALWDLAHGATSSSATLNTWLKDKFMDGGGYVEGSHYLDWLNQQLLPYYYVSIYNGWMPANLQLSAVKTSGYWLLNMADKSGVIAPVDDGVNGENFWLAPHAFLNRDNAFKEHDSSSFPSVSNDPMVFLTYPTPNYSGHWTVNPIGVYEGIGKLNLKSAVDSADLSVTLVTETTGKIKTNGGSHDQQDDGSISIRRVKKNFPNQNDDLIFDPGYAGYAYKGKEEFFNNHNTVQINTLPHGGIDSCPYGDVEYCLHFAGKALGVNLSGLVDNMLGGAILFVGTSPLVHAIAFDPADPFLTFSETYMEGKYLFNTYNRVMHLPVDRIGAGGPGYSDMVKLYPNGFQAKIIYDTKTDSAFRTVLHVGDEIFVIDQISSIIGNYSVHYNMPPGSHSNGSNNVFIGQNKNSKIRLSEFCWDVLDLTTCQEDSFGVNDHHQDSSLHVTSVRFSNAGYNPPPAGTYSSFLTTLEPADSNFSYGPTYTFAGCLGNPQICITKNIDSKTKRYVFVNTVANGIGGTITIPALAGWHFAFSTNAQFGIIDFDSSTKSYVVANTNLYSGTIAIYNGIDVPFNKAMITPSMVKTKVFGNTGDQGSATYNLSSKKIQVTAKNYKSGAATNGFTYGYWYIEGDFDYTFELPLVPKFYSNNFRGKPGFIVTSSLSENDQQSFKAFTRYYDYCWDAPPSFPCNDIPSIELFFQKGIDTSKIKFQSLGYPEFFNIRCVRKGNQIYFYDTVSSEKIVTLDKINYDNLIGNISTNTPGVYLGYTFQYPENTLDTLLFDTMVNYVSPLALSKKTSLTALGYSTNGLSVSGWDLNSQAGYLYSTATGDSIQQVFITSPPISAKRNIDSGVTIEFKAQFPAWYYNHDFGVNNRLQVDINSNNNPSGYSLIFMPTAAAGQSNSYDFYLSKIGGTTLAQLNSGVITPIGSDTAWVKFRIDILPNPSAGGTGEIKVYYDAGDGFGYVQEISVFDTTSSDFQNLTFTYTTGKTPDNYTVRIGDLNVGQMKSKSGLADYRYHLTPLLDNVIYKGNGTWTAYFGYSNPNTVPETKSIGTQNGFSYQSQINQDKGQPTTFNPGTFHSIFNVDFDESSLTWNLDGQSVTAAPLYQFKVEMKDNGISETNISKPVIRITNIGNQAISGLKLRLWFSREEYFSQQTITDKYYVNPSGITLSQGVFSGNANIIYVDVMYPTDFQLAAGAKTTDDGVQLGVHFNNYYPGQWTKSNDWSWQGITGTFSETRNVTVYDHNGNLIWGNEPTATQNPQPPSLTMADIFGFEKLNGWIAPSGTNSLNTTNKTQGTASLKITGGGYQTINSIDMPTVNITGETSTLKVDIFIGPTQPNQYWIGALQLYASCPSAGLYNAYLGQCELTGKPYNAFSTLSFTITNDVLAVLRGTYSDFSFTWVLNTNSNSGPYSLDNMRFSGADINKIEAENATRSGSANVNTNHTGYSGTGFVDGFYNSTTAQVSFTVNAASAGNYALTLHYSAGGGTSANTELYVNGVKIKNITCNGTSNWDTWADETETITLNSGTNTIAYKAGTASGICINLDYITIAAGPPNLGTYEAETTTRTGDANVNTNHSGYSGTGFVDGFYNSTTAQVSFSVNVATAGTYKISLRYSAGGGTSANTGIYVNGTKLKNITCPGTPNWDAWSNEVETVSLNSGANTISYKAESASGICINLDFISVSQ